MNFKQYVLIKESDLEDLYVSDEPTDNIVLLHEMEYKMRQIIENKYTFNPKMYVNVLKRFGNYALESYENISPKFVELFEYWKRIHSIANPKEWAKNIFEEYGDDIKLNKKAYMGGILIKAEDIVKNLSEDSVRSLVEDHYGGDVITFFEWRVGDFLTSKGVPFPPDEDEEYWGEVSPDVAVAKLEELNLEDEFKEYIIEMIAEEPYILGEIELSDQIWINGMAEIMYPEYMRIHGKKLENVVAGIDVAEGRFEKTDELVKKGDAIIAKMNVHDEDLDEDVENLMHVIGTMTSTISLAMNLAHTSGTLVLDYGGHAGLEDVDYSFLSDFNDRDISDWQDELGKIIRK